MLTQFLQDQSIQNRPLKLIYQYIYQKGLASRSDIMNEVNLNRGKVARSLKELLDEHYILEIGHGDSEGGRPPALYQINPVSSYIIGIQIMRYTTKVFLFDLLLKPISETSIVMTLKHSPEMVIEEIKKTIRSYMTLHHFTIEQLLGIGIGAIGPLDPKKGIILHSEPFLAYVWENILIVDEIQSEFPVLTKLDNAANTIVLGECKQYPGYKNILNVTVGWTIGCGAILDNKLLQVDSGDISGYGHIVIHLDGKTCFCGKKGCLTGYSSLYAILDRIKDCSPAFYHDKLENRDPMEQIQTIIASKDPESHKAILDSSKYIGAAVANLVTVFHSELVLVNGPLIDQYPGYFEEIMGHVSLNVNDPKTIQFSRGNFHKGVGVAGAAMQILNHYFE
ncbi:ROK family transcriptional regulator [Bacillus benzoevorans]|uniref:Putative NBD/HSP70 family sugar kinase n=1 Tax=Bacillus benzoevorans TaxID=1456 RepID=A0A7X0HUM4_9BACI|nr:ROK family transcriptional regulator [Bacillus benzoevorans]MBB6447106.1 putative NBD/HSP70 family sugar kinase [Bacillus benzoevorans]